MQFKTRLRTGDLSYAVQVTNRTICEPFAIKSDFIVCHFTRSGIGWKQCCLKNATFTDTVFIAVCVLR